MRSFSKKRRDRLKARMQADILRFEFELSKRLAGASVVCQEGGETTWCHGLAYLFVVTLSTTHLFRLCTQSSTWFSLLEWSQIVRPFVVECNAHTRGGLRLSLWTKLNFQRPVLHRHSGPRADARESGVTIKLVSCVHQSASSGWGPQPNTTRSRDSTLAATFRCALLYSPPLSTQRSDRATEVTSTSKHFETT